MEYRAKPNQSVMRFHNHFETNERGMRSPSLIGETRPYAIVAGDSVVFGGAMIDQAELATTLLSNDNRLVANLSAGTWGPQNMRAALQANDDLQPTGIVVVLSAHDLADVPTFAPLDPRTHPRKAPLLAIAELVTNYLPRYLPGFATQAIAAPAPQMLQVGAGLYQDLLDQLTGDRAPSCIVFHPDRAELGTGDSAALHDIKRLTAAAGLATVDAAPFYRAAQGDIYLDAIHLNAVGQTALAAAIGACLALIGPPA